MSVDLCKNILELEKEILQRRNVMSVDEALKFYDRLIYCQEEFVEAHFSYLENQSDNCFDDHDAYQQKLNMTEYFEKKIIRMQYQLRKFFEPVNRSTSSIESKVRNAFDEISETVQFETQGSLDSLLQKQKFYIQMIDSLKPVGELSSKKAELRYEHVSQVYVWFMSNQSKIMTFVKDAAFDDQVNVSKKIQCEVLSIQETLKEIFSPIKPTASPESKVNDNRTECPHIIDFLGSLQKKQKFFIEKIKMIHSKINNIHAAGAEILFNHLSQLYESFVTNQAKIETYVEGLTLDEELKISGEILEKVISLQLKLKQKFSPVADALPSSDVSEVVDETEKQSKVENITELNSLLDEQQTLIKEIKSIDLLKDVFTSVDGSPMILPEYKFLSESLLERLSELQTSFFSNATKIQKLIYGDSSVQHVMFEKDVALLAEIQNKLEVYLTSCRKFGI